MCIIISRHFSINTNLVANSCKKCYVDWNDVVVTAVNGRFLKKHDPQLYLELKEFIEKILGDRTPKNKRTTMNHSNYYMKKEVQIEPDNDHSRIERTNNVFNENLEAKKKLLDYWSDVEKVDESTKWIPPLSPHNLIEEKFYNDPWALLVVTIFLNKTSCLLALPCLEEFFLNFRGPYDVLKSDTQALEPYFSKLGLVKTRATQIWKMSFDFVNKNWKDVRELYGVGKYAEDAYKMFHLGDLSVEPKDRYLKIYKAWYEMTYKQKETVPESNSQVYLEEYPITFSP